MSKGRMREKQSVQVAAIIPAYNEADRISNVLRAIIDTRLCSEIVVVDDNSQDATAEIAASFSCVRVLKNEVNRGKAQSMERGVQATESDVIFFCDADLQEFTSDIARQIITPVQLGTCDMFIGLRQDFMQQAVHLFALNSGERTLRRSLWNELPAVFKRRFRIETGLNIFAQRAGYTIASETFSYSQTLKEVKYGFWRGMYRRIAMHIDIAIALWFLYVQRGVMINKKPQHTATDS